MKIDIELCYTCATIKNVNENWGPTPLNFFFKFYFSDFLFQFAFFFKSIFDPFLEKDLQTFPPSPYPKSKRHFLGKLAKNVYVMGNRILSTNAVTTQDSLQYI